MNNKYFKLSQLSQADSIKDGDLLLVSRKVNGKYKSIAVKMAAQQGEYDELLGKLDKIITFLEKIAIFAEKQASPSSESKKQELMSQIPDFRLHDGATLKMLAKIMYDIAHIDNN